MICYPLNEMFIGIFKGKEQYLKHLIEIDSLQIKQVFASIDYQDFYQRCQRFYNMDDYQMEENRLIYTHPITKRQSIIHFHECFFTIDSLQGFAMFLSRYFKECFCMEEKCDEYCWISSEIIDEL